MRKTLHKKLKYNAGGIIETHKGKEKIVFIIVFIILAVHCLTLFLPVIWLLLNSVKTMFDYSYQNNTFSLPMSNVKFETLTGVAGKAGWRFDNYLTAFTSLKIEGGPNFFGMLFNSLYYTLATAFLSAFAPAVTGYVLSKYNFKCKELIYGVAIFSMTIPIVGATASSIQLAIKIGHYNTLLFPIIANLSGFTGNFLVYYGFFKSVSWAYAEAAQIDGANPFVIFFKVMMPQAVPMMLTFMLISGINAWNNYETIMLYMPDHPTIASGLYQFKETYINFKTTIYYAGLVISMIPPLVLFACFSNRIMTSISIGGLKG